MIKLDGTISESSESEIDDDLDCESVGVDDVSEGATEESRDGSAARVANDILTQIAEAEADCEDAEEQVDLRKTELKEARAAYDSCVQRLRGLARKLRNEESMPLMSAFVAADEAAFGSTDDGDADDVPSDEWRAADIGDLAIPDGVLEKLRESGVETIGDLEDLRADISNGKAKWPKGIGPAKVTIIEDAVIQWLTVHQDNASGMEENGSNAEIEDEDLEEVEDEAAA